MPARSARNRFKRALEHLDDTIAVDSAGASRWPVWRWGWVGEPCIARVIQPALDVLPSYWSTTTSHGIATVLAFAAITFLHVILGELAPKAIALQASDRLSLWVARPLLVFSTLAKPFVALMSTVGNGVVRMCGYEPLDGHQIGPFRRRAGPADRMKRDGPAC